MKLLRAYIFREHLGPFAVTFGGLTAALLVGNLIKFAELIIAKGVDPFDILRLLLYLVPYLLGFTVPMACIIAIVLTFGRLSSDHELIAMRASGVSPARLIWPFLIASILASSFMLVLNDKVTSSSHLAFRRQLKAIGIKSPTAYLEAGTFIKEFPPYVIFVYDVKGKALIHVRIYEPQPNGPTRTILATRGEFAASPDGTVMKLKLYEGSIDEWDPERPGSLYRVSFGTYSMNLSTDSTSMARLGKKLKEMTFQELNTEERRLLAENISTTPVQIELHRRIASSFAIVVFVLFGLAIGLGRHHHEKLTSFMWVLVLFVSYYLAMVGMNALAIREWIWPVLAMWVPNLVGILAGAVFLFKSLRHQ